MLTVYNQSNTDVQIKSVCLPNLSTCVYCIGKAFRTTTKWNKKLVVANCITLPLLLVFFGSDKNNSAICCILVLRVDEKSLEISLRCLFIAWREGPNSWSHHQCRCIHAAVSLARGRKSGQATAGCESHTLCWHIQTEDSTTLQKNKKRLYKNSQLRLLKLKAD